MNWLIQLFRRPQTEPDPVAPAPDPDWLPEVRDALQKLARAQARSGARLESLEAKLEGGLADLRSTLAAARPTQAAPTVRPDDLLDGLDGLAEAAHSLRAAGNAAAADGLDGILARLGRHAAQLGLERLAPLVPLDGRHFRIVGAVERADLPDGALLPVRAAVLAGDRLVREGEVLINRRA